MSCRSSHRPPRYIPYRTENYSASVRPPLPVSSPFRIAAARKHSALRRVHQPLLRAAAACAIPLRVRKVPIRKNRTGRPDAHTVGRTLRSQKPAAFHIRPLEDRSATIRRPPHRHKKSARTLCGRRVRCSAKSGASQRKLLRDTVHDRTGNTRSCMVLAERVVSEVGSTGAGISL